MDGDLKFRHREFGRLTLSNLVDTVIATMTGVDIPHFIGGNWRRSLQ